MKAEYCMTELTVGSRIKVEISGYAHDGRGVARYAGRVIFVTGVIRGERAEVQITGCRKKIYTAELVRIIEPSSQRVEPLCAAFGSCGGCQLQYMSYAEELYFKQEQVQNALKRIGGLGEELPIREIIGAEELYHYRNKGVFHISRDNGNRLTFWDEGTHSPAGSRCSLLFPTKLAEVAEWLQNEDLPSNISDIMLRISDYNGEMILAAILTDNRRKDVLPLLERAQRIFPKLRVTATQSPDGWHIHSENDFITDSLNGTLYQISPPSFFQINNRQTQKLLSVAADMLGDVEVLIDAYCGIGTIGLYMAAKMSALRHLVGVEVNESAVKNARVNARLNSIDEAEFFAGKAEELFSKVLPNRQPDAVVVDPPRRGCHIGLLQGLLELQSPRILYVSCNPATLARDLSHLTEGGYQVAAVQPVDMFPRTHHVETVVLLSKS